MEEEILDNNEEVLDQESEEKESESDGEVLDEEIEEKKSENNEEVPDQDMQKALISKDIEVKYDLLLQEYKKELEIKYDLLLKEYKSELSDFSETRIEHIFKNSGAKEYLNKLKEKYKLIDEENARLKNELESTRRALAECRKLYQDSEQQCSKYLKSSHEWKARQEQLEAEKRYKNRSILNHSMNFSLASSLQDPSDPPPPPPVKCPSIDELLS